MPDLLIDHIGIVNKQEDEAVEFYQNLLGLEKIKESSVPPELSRQLFSLFQEIRMLVFVRGNLKIEVFLIPGFTPSSPNISHFCLQILHFPELVERLKQAGTKVITGQHGGKTVYFAEDFSGNRIEIKPLSL
ncbi:MAG TPA: VOC family protein [Thermodesulfovibrionales bacterium]|nr:VOC family protein [Thermodesulfovibrionales bacterium]